MKSLKGWGGVIARGMSDNGKNEIGKKGVCPFWNSMEKMLLYQWYISLVYSSGIFKLFARYKYIGEHILTKK